MKRIFNNNYELTGNESLRVCKTYVLSKFIPLGNFRGGPGIRCLLMFIYLHYFSRLMFWFLVRHEHLAMGMYRRLRLFLVRG